MARLRPWGFTDPWDLFRRELLDRNERWPRGASRARTAGVFPPVNIYDDGEGFLVRAEMPGIERDELDVSAKGDQVTIRGARRIPEAGETASYHRRERDSGTFRRSVTMPDAVDPDKVRATYRNGVLEVYAPRAEEARPRTIQVTS